MTARRVVLFVDYQNVYRRARGCFGWHDAPFTFGQVLPLRLGLKISGADPERELTQVRVYRGQPSSAHDPRGFAAFDRQMAAWRQHQPIVEAISRPINYREPDRPREKGIDVRIAIDFVTMAMRDEYDVGVLFSGDTDLLPALEAVAELKGPRSVEVAAWHNPEMSLQRLRLQGGRPWCHQLSFTDYQHVEDTTDYTVPTRRR